MRNTVLIALTASFCLGCSPQASPPTASSPTTASTVSSQSTPLTPSTVTTSPTPEAGAVADPTLPADAATFLTPLPSYSASQLQGVDWLAAAGGEGRLRVYASTLTPDDMIARLKSFLAEDERKSLIEPESDANVAGSRIEVYAGASSDIGVLVSPMGRPPAAWDRLGIPALDWTANSPLIDDKKTLVVFASGKGVAEALKSKSAAIEESETARASGTPTLDERPPATSTPAPAMTP